MFAQVTSARAGKDPHQHLRILESYRDEHGRSKHRVVASLGHAPTPTEAFAALHSLDTTVLRHGDDTAHLVSGGGRDARRVCRALGITDLLLPRAE